MSAFAMEWLNLLIRWAHLIVGIGWIGTSFYFIALDLALRKRDGMREGVYGTAWEVHGGGFYQVEKYLVAPKALPPDLIWYKWEAWLTWLTGFALLIVQYYWNAEAYLISRSVLPMLPAQAIVISVGSLALGWFAYDRICRSAIGRNTPLLALSVFALILLAAWFYSSVFSGRGALIHVGAFIGTMMAANVFWIIIPNQKKIVASLISGEAPDPRLGAIGKQRSVHNNYLTLPVLLMMVSNHYPMLTSHPHIWLVVALIIIVGGSVRHFLNRHDAGDPLYRFAWALPVSAVALMGAIYLTAPRDEALLAEERANATTAMEIANRHCSTCHAAAPRHEGYDAPPKEIVLTSLDDLLRNRDLVLTHAVRSDAMPLGNETGMTTDERRTLGAFLLSR